MKKTMTAFGIVDHLEAGSEFPEAVEYGQGALIGETLYIVNLEMQWVEVENGATRKIDCVDFLPDPTLFKSGHIVKFGDHYRIIDWDGRWVPLESLGTDIPSDLEIVGIHYDDQLELPDASDYEQSQALFWRWNLWFVNEAHQWQPLWERRDPEGISIKGQWPDKDELPVLKADDTGYLENDAYIWRGKLHVVKDGKWSEGLDLKGPSHPPELVSPRTWATLPKPAAKVQPDPNFTLQKIVCGTTRVVDGLTQVMTYHNWITVDEHYKGIWPTEEELPDSGFAANNTLLHRGTLFKLFPDSYWYPATESCVSPRGLTPIQLNLKGQVLAGEDLSPVGQFKPHDAILTEWGVRFVDGLGQGWRGLDTGASSFHISPFNWVPGGYSSADFYDPETRTPDLKVGDIFYVDHQHRVWTFESGWVRFPKLDEQYQGVIDNGSDLPHYQEYNYKDIVWWRDNFWILAETGHWELLRKYQQRTNVVGWVPGSTEYPEPAWFGRSKPDPEVVPPLEQNAELNKLLEATTDKDWEDKGAIARELMERKKEVRALRRALLLRRLTFWLAFVLLFATGAYFGWQWVNNQIVRGWETMEANCQIVTSSANKKATPLTITGKRTTNRPYTSLFGQRWVNEDRQLVQTVVNVSGDKFVVMGLTDNKYWERRIGAGEKGIQILKDAEKYVFVTDQGSAAATYEGFCRPKALQEAEDGDPETAVIN